MINNATLYKFGFFIPAVISDPSVDESYQSSVPTHRRSNGWAKRRALLIVWTPSYLLEVVGAYIGLATWRVGVKSLQGLGTTTMWQFFSLRGYL